MSDAGWLLFFPLFSIWRVLALLRELWWLQFCLHYSLYQECVFEVKPLIAPACCALVCTIKWSLRAGLNWNESKWKIFCLELICIQPTGADCSLSGTTPPIHLHIQSGDVTSSASTWFLFWSYCAFLLFLWISLCYRSVPVYLEANSHGKIPEPSVGEVKGFVLHYKLWYCANSRWYLWFSWLNLNPT